MDKQEILKKMFSEKEQDIYNRVQYKLKHSKSFRNPNSFGNIWKEYWVTKQAIQQMYIKIEKHLNSLFDKLNQNDKK